MKPLYSIDAAARTVRDWLGGRQPTLAVILGSGLAGLTSALAEGSCLPYDRLPGFPPTGVSGHGGFLHAGRLDGLDVLVFQGRYHCYEGYAAWQVTAPVRLAAALGCRHLLVTNAAGGIAEGMSAGDFMLVSDHLNMTGINPLRGRPENPFIDLSRVYCHDFYAQLKRSLQHDGISLHSGVLAWMPGPSYETPAEISALEALGAAAVSMSTVPEAVVARVLDLSVVGLSLIANLAAGKSPTRLQHEDVLTQANQVQDDFLHLVGNLLRFWPGKTAQSNS